VLTYYGCRKRQAIPNRDPRYAKSRFRKCGRGIYSEVALRVYSHDQPPKIAHFNKIRFPNTRTFRVVLRKMANKNIVLITGGNTGIGYETVKALYKEPNAYVILMGSRSLSKANAAIATLQEEIQSAKSEIVPLQIDIEDDASIEKAFKEVESKYGKVDSLINNAGASPFRTIKPSYLG
jgi:hypothetical protein